jgi:hypothetical protein
LAQESRCHQRVDDRVARRRIEHPQAPHLPLRQRQTGDFSVRGLEFPAGTYEVRLSDSADGIALIDNLKNNVAAFTITMPAGGIDPAGEQPALVFDHRENRYLLTQIWESRTEAKTVPGTPARRSSSRARAAADVDDTIVLAANLLR